MEERVYYNDPSGDKSKGNNGMTLPIMPYKLHYILTNKLEQVLYNFESDEPSIIR